MIFSKTNFEKSWFSKTQKSDPTRNSPISEGPFWDLEFHFVSKRDQNSFPDKYMCSFCMVFYKNTFFQQKWCYCYLRKKRKCLYWSKSNHVCYYCENCCYFHQKNTFWCKNLHYLTFYEENTLLFYKYLFLLNTKNRTSSIWINWKMYKYR